MYRVEIYYRRSIALRRILILPPSYIVTTTNGYLLDLCCGSTQTQYLLYALSKRTKAAVRIPLHYLWLLNLQFCTQKKYLNGYCYYAALQATLLFLVNPKGMISRCILLIVCFARLSSQRRQLESIRVPNTKIHGTCKLCRIFACTPWTRLAYPRLRVIPVRKFIFSNTLLRFLQWKLLWET